MKLDVNMYVRTKRDGIGKIISLSIGSEDECCFIELSKRRTGIKEHNIIKASRNIIDLIEVGDYVNGYPVYETIEYPNNTRAIVIADDNKSIIWEESSQYIKSILTKEQFESMKYEVK